MQSDAISFRFLSVCLSICTSGCVKDVVFSHNGAYADSHDSNGTQCESKHSDYVIIYVTRAKSVFFDFLVRVLFLFYLYFTLPVCLLNATQIPT